MNKKAMSWMLLLVMSVLLVSGLNMESAHAEAGLKVPFMNEFLPLFDESLVAQFVSLCLKVKANAGF